MEKMFEGLRILLIAFVLFVNITGFSSAAFLNWMTAGDDLAKEVKANDMPPEWQQDLLKLISCGRIDGG